MESKEAQAAIDALTLSSAQLEQTRDELASNIAEGLARDGQRIKALPSFMRRPTGGAHGEAVVLDAGGRFYYAKDAVLQESSFARVHGDAATKQFRALKDKWDPQRLLQSDLSRRMGV